MTLVITGAIAVAIGGFVLGRATAPNGISTSNSNATSAAVHEGAKTDEVISSPLLASQEQVKAIDDAMIAQSKGEFEKAESSLKQLLETAPQLKGTYTALVILNLQKGDLQQADFFATAGLDAGDLPSRLYELRGLIQARNGQQTRANGSLEMATRSAPYDFHPFLLWADILRRNGNNQSALLRLDQAGLRTHESAEEIILQLKRRLTLLALGRGREFEEALLKELQLNPPSGDWLVTAAASSAQNGDFKSAAEFFQRAKQQLGTAWLSDRLKDPYLFQWCYEKELSPFFAPLFQRATTPKADIKHFVAPENQSELSPDRSTAAAPAYE